MASSARKLSIIIPAYNEEKRIQKTLKDYASFFSENYKNNFEICVVLNGCTDNTLETVKQFSEKCKELKFLNIKEPIGKGGALIKGFDLANGDIIGFIDADDSTKAKEFYRLISFLNGNDGVIGSRWIKGAIIAEKQPLSRRISSRG